MANTTFKELVDALFDLGTFPVEETEEDDKKATDEMPAEKDKNECGG